MKKKTVWFVLILVLACLVPTASATQSVGEAVGDQSTALWQWVAAAVQYLNGWLAPECEDQGGDAVEHEPSDPTSYFGPGTVPNG